MRTLIALIAIFSMQVLAQDVQLSEKEIPRSLVSGRGWYHAENYFGKTSAKTVFRVNQSIPKDALPVIYNTRHQRFAVVMGDLLIRLKNPEVAESLCKEYSLNCESSATVIVARPIGADLPKLLNVGDKISKDPRVQIIQLNLGGRRWGPQ